MGSASLSRCRAEIYAHRGKCNLYATRTWNWFAACKGRRMRVEVSLTLSNNKSEFKKRPPPVAVPRPLKEHSGFESETEVRLLQGSRTKTRFYQIVAKLHGLMFRLRAHALQKIELYASSRAYSVGM
ncbi:hypothetical protein EVAR_42977_1 [Eumeta japonica]|uniref:Uncharacterized protein n=1 Tax=Eumeta variegata TaxID=151549 RepID=A0A4C1WA42_EUMVA|nr:hypothetical protein EVAR_42977_1 [Eumeta japonica]